MTLPRPNVTLPHFTYALALCLAAPSGALAQPTDAEMELARNHFNAGRAYYEDARYDEAVREFQETYRLSGLPDVLYNLAQTYDRLEDYSSALSHYQRFLNLAEEISDRDRVERRMRELEQLVDAGEQQAQTAEPRTAEPLAEAEPGAEPGAGAGPWVVLSVALATGIGAAVTGLMARGTYKDLQSACPGSVCKPTSQSDIDSGRTLATLSTVLTAVAGVGAIVGVTWLLVGGGPSNEEAEPGTVAIVPGPTLLGAGAEVRF